MRKRVSILTFFAATALIIGFQNCGQVGFSQVRNLASASNVLGPITDGLPTSCTLGNASQPTNLKVLFMVDNSDSTNTTDPKKNYRVLAIQNFIQQYGANTTFSYSFGYFSGSTASVYSNSASKFSAAPSSTPFDSAAALSSALNSYININTANGTPYKAAFASIQNTIQADLNLNASTSTAWNYAVVFMSDGQPTDVNTSGLSALVNSILTLSQGTPHSITVSAVYFGAESDSTSISNMQLIAQTGGGQFVDTNKTVSLDFANVITVQDPSCSGGN